MIFEKIQLWHAPELSRLTKASKASWGYTKKEMQSWNAALTITREHLITHVGYRLLSARMLVGYYTYCTTDTGIKLENFFIDPRCINQGYGKEMLTHFLQRISESSASKIYLEADPHAESFYHKFGFKTVGSVPSSIPRRSLPIMELKIGEIPRILT